MSETDPKLKINIDGKTIIRDLNRSEDMALVGSVERTYPLTYLDDYVIVDYGPTLGNKISKIIITPSDNTDVTLKIQYNDLGLSLILPLLEELRVDYTNHISSTDHHAVADSNNIIFTSYNKRHTTLQPAIILASELKYRLNQHFSDANLATPKYHVATGTNFEILSADPTDTTTLLTLVNEIKIKLNLHLLDSTAHTIADIVNTVTRVDASDTGNRLIEASFNETSVLGMSEAIGRYINQIEIKTNSTGESYPEIRIYNIKDV